MDYYHLLKDVPEKEFLPGFHGKMIHLKGFTMAYWRIEAGSLLPEHSHVHEQVTSVVSGQLEMTIGGETKICDSGMVTTIPSNIVHSGKALTDCHVIDVFQPVREDYK
ncbi:MAG: cupin domain-containing protein [Bacteroidota bacterium]